MSDISRHLFCGLSSQNEQDHFSAKSPLFDSFNPFLQWPSPHVNAPCSLPVEFSATHLLLKAKIFTNQSPSQGITQTRLVMDTILHLLCHHRVSRCALDQLPFPFVNICQASTRHETLYPLLFLVWIKWNSNVSRPSNFFFLPFDEKIN